MSAGDRLDKLLKTMPREQAGEGFTARVLSAVEEQHRTPRFHRRALIPVVLGVAIVLVLGVFHLSREREQRAELTVEISKLRRAHQKLTNELKTLRERMSGQPVIYLGGDDRVDYILDLRRLRGGRTGQEAVPIPASNTDPFSRGESL